ncbi:MAG: exodeoxyribonuclease VII small subunit [Planctomycetota bacterium]
MAKKKTSRAKSKADSPTESLDFETSLAQVEQIVVKLEAGELNLTDSLEQYELGIRRLKQCHQVLEAAEQRVNLLAGFDSDGNPIHESLIEHNRGAAAESVDTSVDEPPGLF